MAPSSRTAADDETTRIIQRAGHAVRWVFDPDGVSPPFAYTVGLCDRPGRSYELALTGLSAEVAGMVLNNTVDQLVLDALDPTEGLELAGVIFGYSVRLRRAADTSGFTGMRALYGHQPDVWQVLLPDVEGRFPDGDDYGDDPKVQPLL
ncbi:DUF4262 domain-containing protein [Streptomyces sp. NPDC088915]|uniref:DUF4262 domain-containing protein n=1 Tax=Streptomyces sp. NPDC088915 TaxID=3365912 RepID=UPI0038049600